MRIKLRLPAIAALLLLSFAAGARAAEPVGVLLCAIEGDGHDCEKGRCNRSTITAGSDLRFDFSTKQMCALRSGACTQPRPIHFAIIEDGTNASVVVISAEGNTAVYRIGADHKMLMTFLIGTGRAILFEGRCRAP